MADNTCMNDHLNFDQSRSYIHIVHILNKYDPMHISIYINKTCIKNSKDYFEIISRMATSLEMWIYFIYLYVLDLILYTH